MHRIYTALLFLTALLSPFCYGQVAYQSAVIPRYQFLDSTGKPLAGGFVQSYACGTTTNQATYKDTSGTVNTNPIVLDSAGSAVIYFGQLCYKLVVSNSSSVQQWSQDNIQNFSQQILSTQNVWTQPQILQGAASDPTGTAGMFWYRTDLVRERMFDSAWHTVVGADTTDTLTNKSFDTAGTGNVFKINGTQVSAITGTGSAVLATSPTVTSPHFDRVFSAGTAPTVSVTGFGTSPTIAVETNSTDSFGSVLITAGTTPSATGTVTLTLSSAVGMAPACVWELTQGTAGWAAGATQVVSSTNTTFSTMSWSNNAVALTAGNSYRAVWICGLK